MKNETFTAERIKDEADAFFEWDGEDRSLVTTTSCLLFAQHIAGLMQARSAQPAPVVPEGYVIMPRRLTAENGAKGLLLGEFKANIELGCPCVDDDEASDECEICNGDGSYLQPVAIDWDTIKAIYEKAADGLAAAPAQGQQVERWIPVSERLPACGRAVLAYYLNRQGMGRRIRAEYVTRWTVEAEMFADPDTECVEYSEQEDTYYVTEGWYELIDNWDEYARIAVNEGVVTSWMPLPAAPAAHDKQSGGEV